nr:MAG TPA: hypothetical protein [Microviridae sp.]
MNFHVWILLRLLLDALALFCFGVLCIVGLNVVNLQM